MIELYQGDCLEIMPHLEDCSVDAVICDPPYELGFMGKKWDASGIAYNVEVWRQCLRVLKPGGYLLAFGGTRTYHRMACAIEDAGFEIRDMIEWIYGSGFPKSLDIGKAVDKLQGNEREVVGDRIRIGDKKPYANNNDEAMFNPGENNTVTKGQSEWEGYGTALKPAHEPICMARKPLSEKTVAENCLKWGCGGLNIDGSRVETGPPAPRNALKKIIRGGKFHSGADADKEMSHYNPTQGRFPANLIHDNSEEVRSCFPDVKPHGEPKTNSKMGGVFGNGSEAEALNQYTDSGNASRFFKSIIYQGKASKSERNKGCEGLDEKYVRRDDGQPYGTNTNKYRPDGSERKPVPPRANHHPTVKPTALMEYLINMVSRPDSVILDPFLGSGTTGVAAKNLNRSFIGIEKDPEYFEIAQSRINQTEHQLSF